MAVTLRACEVLDYVAYDQKEAKYSVVPGLELEELERMLRPSSPEADSMVRALRGVYAEEVPSMEVTKYCLTLWAEHRPRWSASKSKALSILLDGIVLAPLLTSITYSARWDEDGDEFADLSAMETFDFSKFDRSSRMSLGEVVEELGIGAMNPKGILTVPPKGLEALQRCYSFFVPMSYATMLANFNTILFSDASWGFGEDAEDEFSVTEPLHTVGQEVQHQSLLPDLLRLIEPSFASEDFASQPRFVVDMGSGHGQVMKMIYEHVRDNTARGKALQEFPLTMVGVDQDEDRRVKAGVKLSKQQIPYLKPIMAGEVSKPVALMAALQKKKVEPDKTLHTRCFLDHARTYTAGKAKLAETSAAAAFARSQIHGGCHIDKQANLIGSIELFSSLLQYFEQWAAAVDGSHGICMLESMMLDVPMTQKFLNLGPSCHADILQSLARQLQISAPAFAMGAAMAGLLPANAKSVATFPTGALHCHVLSQHLVRRPFKIRLAELSDLPALEILEVKAWDENLQAPPAALRKRLEVNPTGVFVVEVDQKVAAVLYTQRIPEVNTVFSETFAGVSDAHVPGAPVVQLIAIASDSEVASLGLGQELRAFALHLARLDATVSTVCAVTRFRDFPKFNGSLQEYLDSHVSGKQVDSIVAFHTHYGAKVVSLVPDYRDEDTDNKGAGVLIQYAIRELGAESQKEAAKEAKASSAIVPAMKILADIMSAVGYPLDMNNPNRGFFDYGMDSLDLVTIRNRLETELGTNLPATLLLDFPTPQGLSEELDRDRQLSIVEEGKGQDEDSQAEGDHAIKPISSWDAVTPTEVIEFQERCKALYKQPHYQKKFTELTKKCYPDMMKYVLSIEHLLLEVEGPLLMEFGLCEDSNWRSVQICREEMTHCITQHWLEHPEIRILGIEIIHLTKQDQCWS